jgi:hypothetical protein
MSATFYSILHVASALLLVGVTFGAFAAPTPERRKATLMWSGILSLLMLTGGFGLLARFGYGWPVWVLIKMVCWLGLSAVAGMAFRKPESVGGLRIVTMVLIVVALVMVYVRPFL